MKIIEANEVQGALNFPDLINALQAGFAKDFVMPPRQVLPLAAQGHDAFALLPAWNDELIGVKAFTYFPDNPAQGFSSLYAKILLFSRQHGLPLALMDGTSLTKWRTAAVSALAARLLARPDANRLLLLGTGNLALPLLAAHLAARPLQKVLVWGRTPHKAALLLRQAKESLQQQYPDTEFALAEEIAPVAAQVDMIVAATASATPLLAGHWIAPGCHVDLLGNHLPSRRECDSELVVRSSVYVDSLQNVLKEAGEILIPIEEKVFHAAQIKGELADMCRTPAICRQHAGEITLFKSVGTALADLLTAQLVLRQLGVEH